MKRLLLLLAVLATALTGAGDLDIYVIDVEGGKSVLFVSPSGQSLLFDAGWPTASNDRILDAVHAAGLKRIDSLVISHFDIDHAGDVTQLAARIPIGHIFDHGETPVLNNDPRAMQRFQSYRTVRDKIGHTTLNPGDRIPLQGVNVQVLSSNGKLITQPLPHAGKPNPLCARYPQRDTLPTDSEDDRSAGLLITFGSFRMLDLADLEAHLSHDLACPDNLIDTVQVYNVNVHGQFKGIAPELIGALQAPVMIQANGPRKGADPQTWPLLRAAPGLQDIWQLHYSLDAGAGANPPPDFTVNPDGEDKFHWLKISAAQDGSFTVTNSRNGFSRHYAKAKP
jgi:competence protein ComEC